MISETHMVSANKVNEFRFGYIYTHELQDLFGPRLYDQYGIKGALDEPRIKGLPQFGITGESTLGNAGIGTLPIPAGGSSNFPSEKSGRIYQLLDNFSWIHADYIENILYQEMTPQRPRPPVVLKEENLNRIRLQEPSLEEYDALVVKRRKGRE